MTQFFIKAESKTAATYTFGPFNIEMLNGAQWFLKYTNAQNTTVNVLLSPYEAHGRDYPTPGTDPFTDANAYETVEQLASGNNSAAGWFDPTTDLDRPVKSFKVQLVVAGTIANCHFAVCSNAAAPG
jgi:hypothetical protein